MNTLVPVDDARLAVVRRGSGPPLLLLVGLGGRCDFWSGTMDHFAGRDCISFDHRKTGNSLGSDRPTTVRLLAEDALGVLDALGIDRADIVGHSLGGAIAQHIAVHAPRRVGRLVISSSWAGPTPAFLSLFDHRRDVLRHCGAEAYLRHGTLLGNPGWWSFTHHEAMQAGIAARLASFPGEAIEQERMDAVCAHDLRDRLAGITAETMVICARDDAITPLPLSEELARLIPGARLEVLESGNHFAPVTTPEAWRQRLEGFLRS
ncbi:alpha/beta fold hydrolase [Polymorphobacter sp.]|uniref:alpha/beta fold hydrolase n=1 Tax=Polymorphobacter sp. TaxID=1909290 RepID=UPI003F72F50F